MSKAVKEAVQFIVNSYNDIQAQAHSYAQQLNVKDIEAELAKADAESVEFVVLTILKNYSAQHTVTVKDTKSTVTVDANSTKE